MRSKLFEEKKENKNEFILCDDPSGTFENHGLNNYALLCSQHAEPAQDVNMRQEPPNSLPASSVRVPNNVDMELVH